MARMRIIEVMFGKFQVPVIVTDIQKQTAMEQTEDFISSYRNSLRLKNSEKKNYVKRKLTKYH
jgi:hypothetical protein